MPAEEWEFPESKEKVLPMIGSSLISLLLLCDLEELVFFFFPSRNEKEFPLLRLPFVLPLKDRLCPRRLVVVVCCW